MVLGYVQAGLGIASALGLGGGRRSARRAAARAAAEARAAQERAERIARQDLAPYRVGGQAASGRLSQLMGLNAFDRDSIYGEISSANPTLFAPREVGTQTPFTTEQNQAVDEEIARRRQAPEYGSLSRDFTIGDYEEDPGYQFRLDQGNKAINAAQAARGGLFSGRAMKEATQYGSDMASQEYGSAYDRFQNNKNTLYNRLAGLTNTGVGAANTGVASAQNSANRFGEIAGAQASANIEADAADRASRRQGLAGLFGGGQSSFDGQSFRGLFGGSGFGGYDQRTRDRGTAWQNPGQ